MQKIKLFFSYSLKIVLVYNIILIFLLLFFRFVDIPSTSFINSIRGITFLPEDELTKSWVSLNEMSPYLPLAAVAAEDQLFFEHFGFDYKAIEKALEVNKRRSSRRIRGASTITQQLAKNLFLYKNRDYIRKGFEVYFTLLIEVFWSKDRILEVYLNSAQTGPELFGVGPASLKFFKKDPLKMGIENSALTIAVFPNPARYNAARPSGFLLRRRNLIVTKMNQVGGIKFIKSNLSVYSSD